MSRKPVAVAEPSPHLLHPPASRLCHAFPPRAPEARQNRRPPGGPSAGSSAAVAQNRRPSLARSGRRAEAKSYIVVPGLPRPRRPSPHPGRRPPAVGAPRAR